MIAASRISALGRMSRTDSERVESAVRCIGELPSLEGTKMAPFIKALQQDKKVRDGAVHFVLPREIGRVEITARCPFATGSRNSHRIDP